MHIVKEDKTRIPLDKETAELLRIVACNSHILEKYVFPHARDRSEYDHIRMLAELMEKTGLDKHHIYAFVKTHRILTTENKKYVSAEDRKEWISAIRQYDNLLETGALKPTDSLIPFIDASKQVLNPKKGKPELKRLFDSRGFHALIVASSRKQFINYDFPDAVFSAYKKLLNAIKEKSGCIQEDGITLVTTVFNARDPILVTPLASWSQDPSIQEGILHLFMGAVLSVRNVFAHKDIYLTETEATLDYLSFASFLFKILDLTQIVDQKRASTKGVSL
jgi:uncharacterized protein (TIGR02391 family)